MCTNAFIIQPTTHVAAIVKRKFKLLFTFSIQPSRKNNNIKAASVKR